MRRFGLIFKALFGLIAGQVQASSCVHDGSDLLLDSCASPTRVDFRLLAADALVPADLAGAAKTSLVVTGTYTSGEKVEPEGFVLDHGRPYDPYVQGWDGLMIITPEGELSLHNVASVSFRGGLSNLRDRAQRRAFVARAKQLGLSAIQSHLLITHGRLDVRDSPGAPRFRRRIVFSHEDGSYGIYDSGQRALTLFEAASELYNRHAPYMAFNLDMGSYDYCVRTTDGREQSCGSLDRAATGKLSNVLIFSQD